MKDEKLTQKQVSALFCAANEKNITGKSVLQEIQPLLEDYFSISVEIREDGMIMKFLNGQTFRISATEI